MAEDRDTLPLPEQKIQAIFWDEAGVRREIRAWTPEEMLAHREEYAAARVAQAVAQERERAAASPQPAPAGWRLVPEAPTCGMVEASRGHWTVVEGYRAMLNAAPQPPSEPPPSAGEEPTP